MKTEISFLFGELFFAFIWILIRAACWLKEKRIDWKREAVLLLIYVNLAVIIRFVFYPMELQNGRIRPLIFDPEGLRTPKINAIPFQNLFAYDIRRELLMNFFGNVVLFIPSGVILPAVYAKLGKFWKTAAAGAGISLAVELLQLLFIERTTDIDDLIFNTLGVILGYGIYAVFRSIIKGRRKHIRG